MQTSALVLDVYDDCGGQTLREIFPKLADIPEQVKQAHVVTENTSSWPDDVFALVMINGGTTLRKYACVDEGNTLLSVLYFLKNAHKLPAQAQVVAAENLKTACSWYGLDVPEELEKIAGMGMAAVNMALMAPGTSQQIKQNLAADRVLAPSMGVVTPQARQELMKGAEVNGTTSMPLQPPSDLSVQKEKAVIRKTASVGRLVHRSEEVLPDANIGMKHKEQPKSLPQEKKNLHPVVDVTNQEPPKIVSEKKASMFAVPSQKKYPLDSYAQVKMASAYFDEHAKQMPPEVRREFAYNLVKRADEMSFHLNDFVKKYGGVGFAPPVEIKVALDARRLEVGHSEDALQLLGEVEKVARYRLWKEAGVVRQFEPEEIVALLSEFDKVAGITHLYDRSIPDPYFSVYGFDKTAEADWSEVVGNETVTEADLKRLARIGAFSVKTTFGAGFQEEFLKDPIGIFKSLPLDQKKMMMRMANSTQPGAERTY